VVEVLSAIHETDFSASPTGSAWQGTARRVGRARAGIENRAVNWILDADIKGFFDNISHEWLMRFVEHRIGPRSDQCSDKRSARMATSAYYA